MLIALYIAGALLALVGWIMVLVVAFSEGGIVWGLLSLFIPIVMLIFVIMHWEDSWKGFLVWIAGTGMMVAAIFMGFSIPNGT